MTNKDFWAGRRVFLTGHTGFKGAWLSHWLHLLGAEVVGYSLDPEDTPNLFDASRTKNALQADIRGDILDYDTLFGEIKSSEAEIVLHLAAQPLVRKSYSDPLGTFSSNVMGTANVLNAGRLIDSVKVVVVVTTDKVYKKLDGPWGYREIDELGGVDPYACSKACAELVTRSYWESYYRKTGKGLASVRAGNVIGGGDWAKDRIVPDTIKAIRDGGELILRNPGSTRPWQFVLEPLGGYLRIAEMLVENPTQVDLNWNFGPAESSAMPVSWIVSEISRHWGSDFTWTLAADPGPSEDPYLKLDSSKAASLGWSPTLDLPTCIAWLVDWYRAFYDAGDVWELTRKQILEFQSLSD